MIYFANPSTAEVVQAMSERNDLGMIDTPRQGGRWVDLAHELGVQYCADNGCFSASWDAGLWQTWLERKSTTDCAFAVAPDKVGDARETTRLWDIWGYRIKELGFDPAYVIQDGLEPEMIPWDQLGWIFIGGTTEFKLGPTALLVTREAKERGKMVHMGRVNSLKRMRIAKSWGCDSADGTFITYGPSVNLPRVTKWLQEINHG